jgi:hypothetical protein
MRRVGKRALVPTTKLQVKGYRAGMPLTNARDRKLSAAFSQAVSSNDLQSTLEILSQQKLPFETVLDALKKLASNPLAKPAEELLCMLFEALEASWDVWEARRRWEIKKLRFSPTGAELSLTRESFFNELCCGNNAAVIAYVVFKLAKVGLYECVVFRMEDEDLATDRKTETKCISGAIRAVWPSSKDNLNEALIKSIGSMGKGDTNKGSNPRVFKELIHIAITMPGFCIDDKIGMWHLHTFLSLASLGRAKEIVQTLLESRANPMIFDAKAIFSGLMCSDSPDMYRMLTQNISSETLRLCRNSPSVIFPTGCDLVHSGLQFRFRSPKATYELCSLLLSQGFENSFVSHEMVCCTHFCALCVLCRQGQVDLLERLADEACTLGTTLKAQKSCDAEQHNFVVAILMDDEAKVQQCLISNPALLHTSLWDGCSGFEHANSGHAVFLALYLRRRKLVRHLISSDISENIVHFLNGERALALAGECSVLSLLMSHFRAFYYVDAMQTMGYYVALLNLNANQIDKFYGYAALREPPTSAQMTQQAAALALFLQSFPLHGQHYYNLDVALDTGREDVIEAFVRHGSKKCTSSKLEPLALQLLRRLWRKITAEFISEKICKELVELVMGMMISPTNAELETMFTYKTL